MNKPKAIKSEKFEFGGYLIEVVELDDGQIMITEDGMEKFIKALTEFKVTDDQARKFSEKISNLKHL